MEKLCYKKYVSRFNLDEETDNRTVIRVKHKFHFLRFKTFNKYFADKYRYFELCSEKGITKRNNKIMG